MAKARLQKTLADYLAIAVTPVLIMLLVGSLVFFLQSLFYTGGHSSRVLWILFWFVIGSVLVARIAMEQGRAQANIFTLGLAGAVSLAMFRFSDAPLVPIICLGIIWWCTDKLTWDCTLIDESEDASGEGLLQVAGVSDESEVTESAPEAGGAAATSAQEAEPDSNGSPGDKENENEKVPLWKRVFLNESERKGKPHAPGLWVVYFSLAALPLFGFGQVMLPPNGQTREFAFLCLLVYVASGLGLLMLTSFLGLRRYLRQRNMQMPTSMALTWVGMGSAIAAGILIACLLLPRPEGQYDVTAMIDRASEEVQEAADWAFLDDSSGEGEGQRSGEADENAGEGAASDPDKRGQAGSTEGQQDGPSDNAQDGQDGTQQGGDEDGKPAGDGKKNASGEGQNQNDSGKPSENGGEQTAQNDSDKPGESGNEGESGREAGREGEAGNENSDPGEDGEQVADSGEAPAGENAEGENGEGGSEAESSADSFEMPELSEAFSMIGDLFKWIIYGLVAAVALFLLIRNWQAIVKFLANLWAEFLSLFGRRPETAAEESVEAEEPPPPPRPFSDFSNPFQTGVSRRKSPSELVQYTFEALQAWAGENGCPREDSQTPSEFGQQLRDRRLTCATEGQEVSQLYARVAYASHRPGKESLPVLEKLWRKMSA